MRSPFNNIQVRLTVLASTVVLLVSLFSLVLLYRYATNFIVNRVAYLTISNMKSYSESLDYFLEEIYFKAVRLQTDSKVREISFELNNGFKKKEVDVLHQILEAEIAGNRLVHKIQIYIPTIQTIISSDRIGYVNRGVDDYQMGYDLNSLKADKQGQYLFTIDYYKDILSIFDYDYLRINKNIYSEKGELVAVVYVGIREKVIYDKIISGIPDYSETEIYLLDEENQIMSTTNTSRIIPDVLDDYSEKFKVNDEGYFLETVNGRETIVVFRTNRNVGYSMVYLLPLDVMTKGIDSLKWVAIMLLGFSVTITIFSLYLILKTFVYPILVLKRAMRLYSYGDFETRINEKRKDEFRVLYEGFNHMAEEVENLVEQTVAQKIRIDREHYKTLQMQIAPHFVYNTLYSIKCIAIVEDNHKIEFMLTALIELLRVSTDNNRDLIPLEEEIKMIQNYILLQKSRYGESFEVYYDVDKEHQAQLVPKFILQPLIENSLKYGIDLKSGKGIIRIATENTKVGLNITVFDNGYKGNIDKINAILLSDEIYHFSEIGITNVNKRIQLIYGKRYGLTYEQIEGKGLVANVLLGLKPSEDYKKIK